MPTYEYKCPKCGEFEVEQRITEDALTTCPTCELPVKKLMPRRLFIQFKGPGFHVNDYSSTGHRSTPTSPPGEVVSDSAGATAADTAPDKVSAKSDTKAANGEF